MSASTASTAKITRLRCIPPTGWIATILIVRAKSYWPPAIMMSRISSMCPAKSCAKVLHYYKEPHPYYNHDVAVIGAKNSAAIAALELFWTGARVTLIHRGSGDIGLSQILDQAEYREPHQERRDPRLFQFARVGDPQGFPVLEQRPKVKLY